MFKLPWAWPLGENSWGLETRLITSAGLLQRAGESGLIVTLVPDLALSGWGGDLSLSTPEREQDFSATTNSEHKTLEARFKSSRRREFASIHSHTPLRGFGPNTSPMPASTDLPVSAWTCTSWNLDTSFNLDACEQPNFILPPYGLHPDNTQRCAISGVKIPTSSEILVMISSANP
jgi:hypothetical protein